jgi:hypothetical protein
VVWGRYCACEILITNPIDWLFAACLRMSRYILNEVETSHHLLLIRLYFILTILITEDDHNHIVFDWIKIGVFLEKTICYFIYVKFAVMLGF